MAGAALLGTLGWSMGWQLKPVRPPTPAVLAPAAVPASPPAAALSVQEPIIVIDAGLRERKNAYRQLAELWGFSLPAGVPCQLARKQGLVCYVGKDIELSELQRLDRPAILTLHDDGGAIYYALLTGLSKDSATLRVGDASRSVSRALLARQFRGELVTFWRSPTARDLSGLEFGRGAQGVEIDWIAAQLARVNHRQQAPLNQVFDQTLADQVQQFQRSHDLVADGVVGARTFMYLNRAAGIDEPRLQHDHEAGK